MNDYVIAQLAEVRRQELIADATIYRRARTHRTRTNGGARRHPRRPLTAFHAWVAAGQL